MPKLTTADTGAQASPLAELSPVDAVLIKLLKSPDELGELARLASRSQELRALRGCLTDAGLGTAIEEGLQPEHLHHQGCREVFSALLRLRAKKLAGRAA